MRRHLSSAPSQPLARFIPLLLAGTVLLAQPAAADGWPVSHGNPANTGWVDIETSAAQTPSIIRTGIGTFADGYAPVVSSTGTVILANQQGRIIALAGFGSSSWERQLNSGFGVHSTPAVASNGNIYVLSSRKVRDHRVTPSVERVDVELNGFSPTGAWLFHFPLPAQAGAIATAPLNVMRAPGGDELIVFPVVYRPPGSTATIVHLFAYSLTGSLETDVAVNSLVTSLESQSSELEHPRRNPPPGEIYPFSMPIDGVAVMPNDPSTIVMNDGINSVVSYRFDGTTFQKLWRRTRPDVDALSPPAISGEGTTFVVGPTRYYGLNTLGQDKYAGSIDTGDVYRDPYTAPTILPGGPILFVDRRRVMHVLGSGGKHGIGGDAIVSAVASRNFIYVATSYGIATFRADNREVASTYGWQNGGRQAPAIGTKGEIYAIADNKLHIFFPNNGPTNRGNASTGGVVGPAGGADAGGNPKPMHNAVNPAILKAPQAATNGADGAAGGSGSKVFQAQPNAILSGGMPPAPETPPAGTQQETALPNSQRFDPPVTMNGNPLSACLDADFEDCGKAAARAFCESKGFAKAGDVDIDTKKVQAETLGGALCTAKKCKIIDKVTCSR